MFAAPVPHTYITSRTCAVLPSTFLDQSLGLGEDCRVSPGCVGLRRDQRPRKRSANRNKARSLWLLTYLCEDRDSANIVFLIRRDPRQGTWGSGVAFRLGGLKFLATLSATLDDNTCDIGHRSSYSMAEGAG